MNTRRLTWYLTNSMFLVILVETLRTNSPYGENIIVGFTWLVMILTVLCCSNPEIRTELRNKGHSVTQSECLIYDFLFLMLLFAGGFWITSIVYIIQVIGEQYIFFSKDETPSIPTP